MSAELNLLLGSVAVAALILPHTAGPLGGIGFVGQTLALVIAGAGLVAIGRQRGRLGSQRGVQATVGQDGRVRDLGRQALRMHMTGTTGVMDPASLSLWRNTGEGMSPAMEPSASRKTARPCRKSNGPGPRNLREDFADVWQSATHALKNAPLLGLTHVSPR